VTYIFGLWIVFTGVTFGRIFLATGERPFLVSDISQSLVEILVIAVLVIGAVNLFARRARFCNQFVAVAFILAAIAIPAGLVMSDWFSGKRDAVNTLTQRTAQVEELARALETDPAVVGASDSIGRLKQDIAQRFARLQQGGFRPDKHTAQLREFGFGELVENNQVGQFVNSPDRTRVLLDGLNAEIARHDHQNVLSKSGTRTFKSTGIVVEIDLIVASQVLDKIDQGRFSFLAGPDEHPDLFRFLPGSFLGSILEQWRKDLIATFPELKGGIDALSRSDDERRRHAELDRIALEFTADMAKLGDAVKVVVDKQADVNLARIRAIQAQQDVTELLERVQIPAWLPALVATVLSVFASLILLHVAQLQPFSPGYFVAVRRRVLGYLILFQAFAPFLLLAILGTAIYSFGIRADVSVEQISNDIKLASSEIGRDVEVLRDFARQEQQRVGDIAEEFEVLASAIKTDALQEFKVVKDELVKDAAIATHAVASVEEEVAGAVKDAVGSVVKKITGAFSFHLPVIGDIDLGIGKFLSKLVPNLHFAETLQKLGVKLISSLEKPFVEPLARLKTMERELVQLAKDDVATVERKVHSSIVTIRGDVAVLQTEFTRAKAAFMEDVFRLVDEFGDILHHVLWLATVLVLVLIAALLYVFIGALLNFWLRFERSMSLIFSESRQQVAAVPADFDPAQTLADQRVAKNPPPSGPVGAPVAETSSSDKAAAAVPDDDEYDIDDDGARRRNIYFLDSDADASGVQLQGSGKGRGKGTLPDPDDE
jgi:hypothetical protein